MAKSVLIFDDLGDMFEVEDFESMLSVAEDELVLILYKSTLYEHNLILAMEELVQKGYVEDMGNRQYSPEMAELGIQCLQEDLIKRFGDLNFLKIKSEVDMNWEKNKPRIPNKNG
jgi:hypothetical protein